MNIEIITQELETRFSKPLDEFYKRRIIVWYDPEKEFEEDIESLELYNAKVISLEEDNNFTVKKTICLDDLESNYLIYTPLVYNLPDDNWLYDVFAFSEEFRSDRASLIMDELGMSNTIEIRERVKKYSKYFNAKDRIEKVDRSKRYYTENDLDFEVLRILSLSNTRRLSEILINVFSYDLELEKNSIFQEFVKYNIDDVFWDKVSGATGYYDENPNLNNLLLHMLLTATSRDISIDAFTGLDSFIKPSYDTFCYEFASIWLDSNKKNRLYELTRQIEEYINLEKRLYSYSADDLEDCSIFSAIDELILKKLLVEIENDKIDPNRINRIIDKRRVKPWYQPLQYYYEGIAYYTKMYDFWRNNISKFHYTLVKELWTDYEKSYFRMDQYYRKFQLAYQNSLKRANYKLDDDFKSLVERTDNLYKNWYLLELNDNWNRVSEGDFSKYGRTLEITNQEDFYKIHVANDKDRKFVIISDALRYEVASELADVIKKELQGKVSLQSMQGIYPTATKFGMAALLPHEKLSLTRNSSEIISVLADSIPTDANYRESILKKHNPDSLVIKYEELISMRRQDRKDLVKGNQVIYIYHDRIDSASHTDEDSVFEACEDAIIELKELTRLLVNDFSAINIFVTSDHGFNYTYTPFSEMDKVDKSSFNNKSVELGRRYVITEKGAKTDFLIPVNLINGSTDFEGYSPREIKRFKAGGGLKYVHGGLSLQELVVPLIKYQHVRSSYQEYQKNRELYDTKPVELALISSIRKTSNMIFTLQFYQTEAVNNLVDSVEYEIYFEDQAGKKVSDIIKIIADRKSEKEQERVFRPTFNLISQKYSSREEYFLVIYGKDERLVPKKIPFVIDIAVSLDGFDFFS